MITFYILLNQKNSIKNDIAKSGIDIYFNDIKKIDDSIYQTPFTSFKDFRKMMIYFDGRFYMNISEKLRETYLDVVRGNENKINFTTENKTTDFSFILHHSITKKPILIGLIKRNDSKSFIYQTVKFDNETNDYEKSVEKIINISKLVELIDLVSDELILELENYKK